MGLWQMPSGFRREFLNRDYQWKKWNVLETKVNRVLKR